MMDKENLQLRRLPLSKSDEDAATRLLYFDLESVKDIKTL